MIVSKSVNVKVTLMLTRIRMDLMHLLSKRILEDPSSTTFVHLVLKNLEKRQKSMTCNRDFDCDGDVDGMDASTFKFYFERNLFFYPCDEKNP